MTPWLIDPDWMRQALAEMRHADRQAASAARRGGGRSHRGKIAVLPLVGPLMPRLDFFGMLFGGTSTLDWAAEFDAAVQDSAVDAIVVLIDSPGGTATGTPELAERIRRARGVKPVIGVVESGIVASAAYWMGSAAERLYITPSSEAGSIGVFALVFDETQALADAGIKVEVIRATDSPHKIEGSPFEPISDAFREHEQGELDRIMRDFVASVARNRRTTPERVKAAALAETLMALDKAAVDHEQRIAKARKKLDSAVSAAREAGRAFDRARSEAHGACHPLERRRDKLQRQLREMRDPRLDAAEKRLDDAQREMQREAPRTVNAEYRTTFGETRRVTTHSTGPTIEARCVALREAQRRLDELALDPSADLDAELTALFAALPKIELVKVGDLPVAKREERQAVGI